MNNLDITETRKELLIDELLHLGIFKLKNHQLFELSLIELEEEYERIKQKK